MFPREWAALSADINIAVSAVPPKGSAGDGFTARRVARVVGFSEESAVHAALAL